MNHVCSVVGSKLNRPDCDFYTCGLCGETFSTICSLHQHVIGHSSGGSYHYDDIIKVAFPKYDSTCTSTQTDDIQTNYLKEIKFAKRFGLFEGFKQRTEIETDQKAVEDKGEDVDVGPLIIDVNKLRKSVRKEQKVENEGINILSATDAKERRYWSSDVTHTVSECCVEIQKLTADDLNSFKGEQDGMKFESNFRQRKRNSGGVKKAASSAELLSSHLSDSLPELNKKNIDGPTVYIEDDDGDDSDINNYSAENWQEEANNIGKNKQTNDIIGLKSPEIDQLHKKIRKKITISESETDGRFTNYRTEKEKCKKRLVENKNEKQNLARDSKMQNVLTDNQKGELEIVNDKYIRDMDDNENVDSDENESQKDKEYFYGKIASRYFIIERNKPTGIFCKGEKDDRNQVFVDNTWLPVSKWTNESVTSANKQSCDEAKFSKVKDLYGIDEDADINDLPQEEVKGLRKKWKYKQRSKMICNICSKSFKRKHHFEGHMNLHAGLKPYMCHYCGKSYPRKSTLQTHEQHMHSDTSTWFKCTICNEKSFPTLARLRDHENTHATDYVYICDTCNKSYKSLKLLKAHEEYSHSSKNYRCKNCKKSFHTIEERNLHQKVEHDAEIKCMTCGRQFTTVKSKQRHEKIHLGVKPHECHICLRSFLQKTPFWVHMEKHHDLTKADLIRLFPEKHLNRNQQHLITQHFDTDMEQTADYGIDDNELIMNTSEETTDLHIGDNELIIDTGE